MRGSNAVEKSEVLAVPDSEVVPATFAEALRRGWRLISENTNLGADKRHRHGRIYLQMAGRSERLVVDYTATIRQGYRFGRPEQLN
ncbi:MAG: hypothetical protein WCA91_13295 [Candidatus Acidiferrales bacterium]